MIQLVAEGARQKVAAAHLKRLAVAVHGADGHVLGAANHAKLTGQRQAALRALLLAGGSDDLGIDQLNDLTRLGLDDHDAAQNADLRCGQTDTVSGAHGLEHVVQQREDCRGDLINGAADATQRLVAVLYDFSFSHGKCPFSL